MENDRVSGLEEAQKNGHDGRLMDEVEDQYRLYWNSERDGGKETDDRRDGIQLPYPWKVQENNLPGRDELPYRYDQLTWVTR